MSFIFTFASEIRMIESRMGKPLLQMGVYRFNQHSLYRNGGPKVLWVCGKWSSGCRASITTIDNEIVKMNVNHTH